MPRDCWLVADGLHAKSGDFRSTAFQILFFTGGTIFIDESPIDCGITIRFVGFTVDLYPAQRVAA
jgi:hypothetical protein